MAYQVSFLATAILRSRRSGEGFVQLPSQMCRLLHNVQQCAALLTALGFAMRCGARTDVEGLQAPEGGAPLCLAGLLLLFASLVSFGRSFRVGIDDETADALRTGGVFAWSRNPMYVAFRLILLGQLLVFPNPLLLVYLAAATWLFPARSGARRRISPDATVRSTQSIAGGCGGICRRDGRARNADVR